MAFHTPQHGKPLAIKATKITAFPESIFWLWNERKESLNITGLGNSQFAKILLLQSPDATSDTKYQNVNCMQDPILSKLMLLSVQFNLLIWSKELELHWSK